MKKLISIIIALFVSISAVSEESASVRSALNWLEVVDSGKYEESWQKASPFFQSQISSPKWVEALNQVRSPLGGVISRELHSANEASSLPGVPDGEYVVITLITRFKEKAPAIETITVSKSDSEWKSVGYFIK